MRTLKKLHKNQFKQKKRDSQKTIAFCAFKKVMQPIEKMID